MKKTRGQALVEFAMVAPLFFLLLFGIIEAGRFIYYYETLSNATREGARYAIVHGEQSLEGSWDCPNTGPDTGTTSTSCDPTGEDVARRVQQSAIGMVGSEISVDRCWWYSTCNFTTHGDGNFARGANVTVRATYTYSSLIPFKFNFFDRVQLSLLPDITVRAESSLVINN